MDKYQKLKDKHKELYKQVTDILLKYEPIAKEIWEIWSKKLKSNEDKNCG